jgi:hypothetical protein
MKLSPEEIVFIDRLRLTERCWPVARWLILIAGLLLMFSPLIYAGLIHEAGIIPRYFQPLLDMTGTLLPILTLSGAFISTYARINWRGVPTRRLLIRLVDHALREHND